MSAAGIGRFDSLPAPVAREEIEFEHGKRNEEAARFTARVRAEAHALNPWFEALKS